MNDIISKATFGFLMAQLFPGAVAVFGISFMYFASERSQPAAVLAAATRVLEVWANATVAQQVFLVALCIAFGMLIHGVNWAILGALENRLGRSVFNSRFHAQRIGVQMLLAPGRAIWELLHLLYAPRHLREARMEENVVRLPKDRIDQFKWVEDFYLYSAQFFAHTTWSLLLIATSVMFFVAVNGLTSRRVALFVFLYGATGVFFTIGRIQFASLFHAEEQLASGTEAAGSTTGGGA